MAPAPQSLRTAIWVVRPGRGGRAAQAFREGSLVALPVSFEGDAASATTEELIDSGESQGRAPVVAALLRRFASDLQVGDIVISPTRNGDMVGVLSGPYLFESSATDPELRHRREVIWRGDLERADVPLRIRRALGSPMMLYQPACQTDLHSLLATHGLIRKSPRDGNAA
jgi:predicted Mrr-cat superfamily restriction endonuclease